MSEPFISRQDLSDRLGQDVTADAGALSAIDAACQTVRTIAEQDFDLVWGDTIRLDGTGTDCLLLPQQPVIAAGTVTVNGNPETGYTLSQDGRLIRTSGTATFNATIWSLVWPRGRQNIGVTYDHGAGTVPSDVREVALALASRMVVQGVAQSETIGDVSISYGMAATDLTANELRILYKYRRAQSF